VPVVTNRGIQRLFSEGFAARLMQQVPAVKYLTKAPILLMLAISAFAADTHTGQIRFGQVPLPGAVVRATQGEHSVQTVSDLEGRYAFQDLGTGTWTVQVEMPGFEVARREWIGGPFRTTRTLRTSRTLWTVIRAVEPVAER